MMKKRHGVLYRLGCVFFSALMLAAVIPASATAVEDFSYQVVSEDEKTVSITKYNGQDSVVEIPATINGYTVISIGTGAFLQNLTLESLVVPQGVEQIDARAFAACVMLREISLPDSLLSIGDSAFSSCASLQSFFLPKNLSAFGANVLSGCMSLQAIEADEENTKFSTQDGVLFTKDMAKLIAYPAQKTQEAYRVPETVRVIETSAFFGNAYLKRIALPPILTAIEPYTFGQMSSLQQITLPNTVMTIGTNAFSGCSALKSVSLPDALHSIDAAAFANCSALSTLKIPEQVQEIGENAFTNCTALTGIALPSNLQSLGYSAFAGCTSLTYVRLPASLTRLESYLFANCTSLACVVIPEGVTRIGFEAFYNCPALLGVTLPKSITNIEQYAFGYFGGEFESVENFTLFGDGSITAVQRYASANGFAYYDISASLAVGDITDDGLFTAADYARVVDALSGDALNDGQRVIADLNGDTVVDAFDAAQMQLKLSGIL